MKTFKVTLKDKSEPKVIIAEKCQVAAGVIYFGDRDNSFPIDSIISVEKLPD